MGKQLKIRFICSGNVFRSMIAEQLMKEYLQKNNIDSIHVASAGITANPQEINANVLAALKERSIDASHHKQTKLTKEIIDDTDLLIAMGLNHQKYVKDVRGLNIPVFNELGYREHTPIYDRDEVIKNQNPENAARYQRRVIHHIESGIPSVLKSIQDLFHL